MSLSNGGPRTCAGHEPGEVCHPVTLSPCHPVKYSPVLSLLPPEEKLLTTITHVARRAGVSPVTVSRVINNAPNVRVETREKVERVIRELGYVPNEVARSLRSRRTLSLALLLPDITNAFWTTVARGVEDAAQGRGYTVFLCNTDEDPAKQARYLESVTSQRADGVIIAPCDSSLANVNILRERKIPSVLIDRRVEGWEVDTVIGDSFGGARALVKHLIGLGYRRIAMISGPQTTSTAEDRVAGYCVALSEAGIALDQSLIRRGEFRVTSGEQLMAQLLDEGVAPTAVFAANNAIAMGVVEAVEQRGLRIPHDIALVCFDDFPNASHLFPFLTVAVQSAYNMGLNAAQLLLSRIDAEVPLQPRHVLLPVQLIIRHSCGSQLHGDGDLCLSLPLAGVAPAHSSLVKPLPIEQHQQLCQQVTGVSITPTRRAGRIALADQADVNRLLTVLQHQEADRAPHLEFWVTSKAIYEYVLERELKYDIVDARIGRRSIAPEDDIEFAQRLGMDAATCNFFWRPGNVFGRASDGAEHYVDGRIKSWADLDDLDPPPALTDQLSHLERYLRAAQGTGVGVVANFTSFFDSALLAIGMTDALYTFLDRRSFIERMMDILLRHQERVVRAVCDRFAEELAFILIDDDIAYRTGLMVNPDLFEEVFRPRMARLMEPAREHGKLLALHTAGKIDMALPIVHDLGFDIVHPIEPEANDIFALREQWAGKLAFVGNVPTSLLAFGTPAEIEETVRTYCERLAPGGGYVVGSSGSIVEGIPPQNFVTMVKAVHRYGRYGFLGHEQ